MAKALLTMIPVCISAKRPEDPNVFSSRYDNLLPSNTLILPAFNCPLHYSICRRLALHLLNFNWMIAASHKINRHHLFTSSSSQHATEKGRASQGSTGLQDKDHQEVWRTCRGYSSLGKNRENGHWNPCCCKFITSSTFVNLNSSFISRSLPNRHQSPTQRPFLRIFL